MAQFSGKKIISGTFWAASEKLVSMGIQFLTNLILARLLMPSDFGCIGMLAIFIAVSQTIVDGGFGSALIQKKEPSQLDYSTIFYWNLFFSIGLYVILFVCAPFIASFYEMPVLTGVLRFLGGILIINALGVIQINRLRKQLAFRLIAIINIVSYLVAAIVAVLLAICGFGVWSLVVLQLLFSLFSVLLFWVYTRWYPSLCFSWESLQGLFRYGGFLFFANVLQEICKNLQGLIIGRKFSSSELGLYTQAKKLGDVTYYTLPNIIVQVMFPVYSQMQSDLYALRNALRLNVRIISFIIFPMMILFILLAPSIIDFLYGEKWLASAFYFQMLCVGGLFVCLQNINYYAVAALGKSKVLFRWSFYKWGMLLLLLLIGMHWGMTGILFGMVVSELNIYMVNAFLVSRYIHYSFVRQCLDSLPLFLFSFVVGWVVYMLDEFYHIHVWFQVFIYLLLYISASMFFCGQIRKDLCKVVDAVKRKNGENSL